MEHGRPGKNRISYQSSIVTKDSNNFLVRRRVLGLVAAEVTVRNQRTVVKLRGVDFVATEELKGNASFPECASKPRE